MGEMPNGRPDQFSQNQAGDDGADIEESRRHRRNAELIAGVQDTHGLRRRATSSRNGNMMRVIVTASSNLPGVLLKSRGDQLHELGTQDDPEHADAPDNHDQSGGDEIGKHAGLLARFRREILR